jgi:hypothetical protein
MENSVTLTDNLLRLITYAHEAGLRVKISPGLHGAVAHISAINMREDGYDGLADFMEVTITHTNYDSHSEDYYLGWHHDEEDNISLDAVFRLFELISDRGLDKWEVDLDKGTASYEGWSFINVPHDPDNEPRGILYHARGRVNERMELISRPPSSWDNKVLQSQIARISLDAYAIARRQQSLEPESVASPAP